MVTAGLIEAMKAQLGLASRKTVTKVKTRAAMYAMEATAQSTDFAAFTEPPELGIRENAADLAAFRSSGRPCRYGPPADHPASGASLRVFSPRSGAATTFRSWPLSGPPVDYAARRSRL
jgi:hypothetical protein